MFRGQFPFFGQQQSEVPTPKPVDTQALYNVLGIPKTASPTEIRKSYMSMARKEHPDKGGNEEKFKEITKAYEILNNPETRAAYDTHGEEGLQHGGHGHGPGSAPADIFAQMFQRSGGSNRTPRRGKDIVNNLNVALEDVYSGKVLGVKMTQEAACQTCKASGCIEGAVKTVCITCDGRGTKVSFHRMGPMVQQVHAPCEVCNATGKRVEPADLCPACSGKTTRPSETVFEIVVERGMKSGDTIVISGKGGPCPAPGADPGDLVFIIQVSEHSFLHRQGCDLVMQKKVTLLEALTGVLFAYTHLDGTQVSVKSAAGDVIAPGDVRAFIGKGMPMRGNTFIAGDLFIKFDVEFPGPGSLSAASISALQHLLPRSAGDGVTGVDGEPGTLSTVNLEAAKEREKQMRAYDEENDAAKPHDARQQQGVQCAQQ